MATKKTRTTKSPDTATTQVAKTSTKRTRTKTTVAPLAVRAPRTGGEGDRGRGRVTHEEIARRAYQLWEQRGYAHGHDVEDWAAAESQLLR